MWQFIISGYIPGTELQVTFDVISTFALSTFSVLLLFTVIKHRKQINREINKIIADIENQRNSDISI